MVEWCDAFYAIFHRSETINEFMRLVKAAEVRHDIGNVTLQPFAVKLDCDQFVRPALWQDVLEFIWVQFAQKVFCSFLFSNVKQFGPLVKSVEVAYLDAILNIMTEQYNDCNDQLAIAKAQKDRVPDLTKKRKLDDAKKADDEATSIFRVCSPLLQEWHAFWTHVGKEVLTQLRNSAPSNADLLRSTLSLVRNQDAVLLLQWFATIFHTCMWKRAVVLERVVQFRWTIYENK